MNKRRIFALVLLLVLSAATGSFFYFRRNYGVIHPHRGSLTEAVYGLGKVKSDQRYEVILGVLSTVTKKYVVEGDYVAKGAPLIEFESRTLFRAPFAGTVTYTPLFEGETALPHVPLLRIENLANRYIELSLEQQAALRVRRGQAARVSFETLRGKVLIGKVASLFPREDEFLARIEVAGLEDSVLPGMTADVTVEIGQIQDALLVPIRAIRDGTVAVRRNGHWRKEKVEVGHVDGMFAEILPGAITEQDELRVRGD